MTKHKKGLYTINILENKNFMLLFSGRLISQLGDCIYGMATAWYILSETKSASQMALFMSFGTIVFAISSPIGGIITDRLDRKLLLCITDFIRGIMLFILSILMYLNITSISSLYIAAAILSICSSVFTPASSAILPTIVSREQLMKANSLTSMIQNFSNIFGIILGGILYSLIGIKGVFVINAISFIISGIIEIFLTTPKAPHSLLASNITYKNLTKDLYEAYIFLRGHKTILFFMLFSTAFTITITPIFAIYAQYYFTKVLALGPKELSYVNASVTLGILIGAFLLTKRSNGSFHRLISTGIMAYALFILGLHISILLNDKGFLTHNMTMYLFIILYGFFGILNSLINIPFSVVLQSMVPNQVLGRINALSNTFATAASPIGMIVGGFLADRLQMSYIFLMLVFIMLLLALFFNFQKDIKQLNIVELEPSNKEV
ncbi:MAG: MFS transporter [Bacillota bacterium]|nr:MFS transporter [Bacillota bacterium]